MSKAQGSGKVAWSVQGLKAAREASKGSSGRRRPISDDDEIEEVTSTSSPRPTRRAKLEPAVVEDEDDARSQASSVFGSPPEKKPVFHHRDDVRPPPMEVHPERPVQMKATTSRAAEDDSSNEPTVTTVTPAAHVHEPGRLSGHALVDLQTRQMQAMLQLIAMKMQYDTTPDADEIVFDWLRMVRDTLCSPSHRAVAREQAFPPSTDDEGVKAR